MPSSFSFRHHSEGLLREARLSITVSRTDDALADGLSMHAVPILDTMCWMPSTISCEPVAGAMPTRKPLPSPPELRASEAARGGRAARLARWRVAGLVCTTVVAAAALWGPAMGIERGSRIELRTTRVDETRHIEVPDPSTPAQRAQITRIVAAALAPFAATTPLVLGATASEPRTLPPEDDMIVVAPSIAPHPTRVVRVVAEPDELGDSQPDAIGQLTVQTMPSARVVIDGQDTGRVTPVRDLPLGAGRHVLELQAAGAQSHRDTIDIPAGETVRIVRQL